MIRRVAAVLIVGALMTRAALAQSPSPTPPPSPDTAATAKPSELPAATVPRASLYQPIPTDPAHPNYHEGAHKTIVRHNPLPRRTSYNSNYQRSTEGRAGYSNMGVGRYAEYYDPQTLAAPVDNHPTQVAGFGNGGQPDRNEQISAQQAGQVRARNIQNDLNAFGAPMNYGFGYGLGLGGGRLYTYPY